MAIYKGREVIILGTTGGEDVSPMYTIQHQDGQRESVKLNQLQFTEQEVKDAKDNSQMQLENVQVINNKDLQDLRDSQDREKIEKAQSTQSSKPVEVNKIMVNPDDIRDKSTITPQMKMAKK